MFRAIKNAHQLSSIAAKWAGVTNVDPGDHGQISNKAMEYINNLGMAPGDAWLTAFTNWMNGMPYRDSQVMLANGLIQFLDSYEGKIALSAATILAARHAANEILQ